MSINTVRSVQLTVAATTAGTEVENILGGVISSKKGILDQVIIRNSAGGGTDCDVQVRYLAGSSNVEDLVYDFTSATYPHIDSSINAPFDTGASVQFQDLVFYVKPQADGTLEVRLDFRIIE